MSARFAPERTDVLDGVLACFEPHGTTSAVATVQVGRRTAMIAARHSGELEPAFLRTPVADGDDGVVVVADVRLDHRGDLAGQLSMPVSSTDPELLLGAYRRWGERCAEHLYGDFAFAVVDPRRGGVLLVRDHAGHRPLMIHEGSDLFAFASTALALTGLDGVGHRLDSQRSAEVLALAYGTDRTFVEGVRMMPAGTAMWVDDGGVRSWRWWDSSKIEIADLGSLDAHGRVLRQALDAAVASQLRTVGGVGVMLSGGLDSTAVAATAASLVGPREVSTYTSVPPMGWVGQPNPAWDPDERHLVEALAATYPNLRPRFIEVSSRNLFEHHETLWELGAGPTRNTMNVMWIFAIHEEAAADGVTAMLTGAAGNQAFSADGPRWLVDLLRRGRLPSATRELRAWSEAHDQSHWATGRREVLALVAPRFVRDARRRARGDPGRLDHWLGATALRPDRAAELDLGALLPMLTRADTTGWTRQHDGRFGVGASQAETNLAVRAWWGVDSRDPTSDRRLVEAALAQPEWWRRHRGVDRAVVRSAMAGRVPSEIIDRSRRGAQLPDWYDRMVDAREELEAELEEARDHPASRDVIDVDRIGALLAAWPERNDSFSASAVRNYQLAVPRALMLSRYLRWFERRARRLASGGPAVVLPPR